MLQNLIRKPLNYRRAYNLIARSTSNLQIEKDEVSIAKAKPEPGISHASIIDSFEVNDAVRSVKLENKSVFDKCEEDISHIAPYLKPTFNFAAYVNKSETLQQLVKMGVNLHKLEKMKNVPEFIIGLDFERDMKKYIIFLHDLGLTVDDMAEFISKYPLVFKEDLENLQVRINYFKYKKFTDEMILHFIQRNPVVLSFSTQEIDENLGFIQKSFGLQGNEVRKVVVHRPTLITRSKEDLKESLFVIKEEMGFTPEEMKKIVLKCPVIFTKNCNKILKSFEYAHKNMKISLSTLSEFPKVLTCRATRLKERHLFLERLGKAQYDPRKPGYVSLEAVITGNDIQFATEVAKSSIQAYNAFLKTL